jgi:single-strand selective monofunctional uracil DNA glycosylase
MDPIASLPAPLTASALAPLTDTSKDLLAAARTLNAQLASMHFAPPVAAVLNPLDYAWGVYERYVRRFAAGPRRVVFLGMNPGPFGMMQTGVPFGEIAAVRDWMGLMAEVKQPAHPHPKRPIQGFACNRSEVSGRRLWTWVAERWRAPETFFAESFVLNWCPLAFLEVSGRNFTPDRLPASELRALEAACDEHLQQAVRALQPQWVVGVGGFAERRVQCALRGWPAIRMGTILHPSPASSAANRGWAEQVNQQLADLGVWPP